MRSVPITGAAAATSKSFPNSVRSGSFSGGSPGAPGTSAAAGRAASPSFPVPVGTAHGSGASSFSYRIDRSCEARTSRCRFAGRFATNKGKISPSRYWISTPSTAGGCARETDWRPGALWALPFVALPLFQGELLVVQLGGCVVVATPELQVQHPQRGPGGGHRQRAVPHQPAGPLRLIQQREADDLILLIGKGAGVLGDEHARKLRTALRRRRHVAGQEAIDTRPLMFENPMAGLPQAGTYGGGKGKVRVFFQAGTDAHDAAHLAGIGELCAGHLLHRPIFIHQRGSPCPSIRSLGPKDSRDEQTEKGSHRSGHNPPIEHLGRMLGVGHGAGYVVKLGSKSGSGNHRAPQECS